MNVGGNFTVHGSAVAVPRPLIELAELFDHPDVPAVAEVNPYLLGATASAFGNDREQGHDRYVARTHNEVDTRLAVAVAGERMVIVVGPSKAGKTRTLFEAVLAHDRAARVLVPFPGCFGELASHPRIATTEDPIVVWLDDLNEFLNHSDPLTPGLLARLSARPGRTRVVATLRAEARDRLRRGTGEFQRDTRRLLERASTIDLASTSDDPYEQAAAARAYPGQNLGVHGLAEILAGAPELLKQYDDARAADPLRHMVIQVVIDWTRVGRGDPIPEPTLTEFAVAALRATRSEIETTLEQVRDAITAARTPPQGLGRVAALLTSHLDEQTRGYRPFDYLAAADDGQDNRKPRPIPNAFWHKAIHNADPDTLLAVGFSAYQRDNTPEAASIFRKAAATDNPEAMFSLGVLLAERGETGEAESWYRKATDGGNTKAMTNLGNLLVAGGETGEAESWYRKATDGGHTKAMFNLGILLETRGETGEAESWYRKAADGGDTDAMTNLGILLVERGETGEAESWYRKAGEGDKS